MSKRFLSLTTMALLSLTLAACNNAPGEAGPAGSDIIKSVMESITGDTIAARGALKYSSLMKTEENATPQESTNSIMTSVLTPNYVYMGRGSVHDDSVSGTRYDRGSGGEAVVYQLNPLNNTVEQVTVYDRSTGQAIPFDGAFANPFNKNLAPYCFEAGNEKISLVDTAAVNFAYLFNLFYGGKSLNSNYQLSAFDIGFDKDYKATSLYIEFTMENDYVIQKDIYDGAFIDASTVAVNPVPTPRAEQAGQEKLGAMFEALRAMNYTAEVEYTTAQGNFTFVTYVTPSAYYIDTNGHSSRKSKGAFETAEGLVEFESDGTNLKATSLPKQIRTVDKFFENYWSYSPQSFDVDATDGSFTVANEPGFTTYLFQYLTTESLIHAPISPENIRLSVDETANTLSYEYSSGTTSISGVVKNIGTTSLPITMSDIVEFIPATNWTDWVNENTRARGKTLEFLTVLTDDHIEAVPFVYSQYDFHNSVTSQGPITINMTTFQFTEEIKEVKNFTTAYQYDTCNEAVAAYSAVIEKVNNDGYFTYDEAKDIFTYRTENVNLTMEIYIIKDFLGAIADEVYNYALMVDVQNIDYVPKDYEPIFI